MAAALSAVVEVAYKALPGLTLSFL